MVSVGAPRVIAGTGTGTDMGSSISEVDSGMGCVHSPAQPDNGRDGEVKTCYNGTPARWRLVRMVCKVCTRLTVGEPVSRWVS